LGASLVDLATIRLIVVNGTTAIVELALTIAGCPLAEWLTEQMGQTYRYSPASR